eukprot:TRINITY_DN55029_c0_g1_i1.p1 TRINITY_DN55029_c0_g1~~TRINITY_DN55029_c0_g1_i1.p1  ORF type:complete len:536 (+),score=41.41 TRINITY_DN55029_c0_g1_i1:27-1634(+)
MYILFIAALYALQLVLCSQDTTPNCAALMSQEECTSNIAHLHEIVPSCGWFNNSCHTNCHNNDYDTIPEDECLGIDPSCQFYNTSTTVYTGEWRSLCLMPCEAVPDEDAEQCEVLPHCNWFLGKCRWDCGSSVLRSLTTCQTVENVGACQYDATNWDCQWPESHVEEDLVSFGEEQDFFPTRCFQSWQQSTYWPNKVDEDEERGLPLNDDWECGKDLLMNRTALQKCGAAFCNCADPTGNATQPACDPDYLWCGVSTPILDKCLVPWLDCMAVEVGSIHPRWCSEDSAKASLSALIHEHICKVAPSDEPERALCSPETVAATHFTLYGHAVRKMAWTVCIIVIVLFVLGAVCAPIACLLFFGRNSAMPTRAIAALGGQGIIISGIVVGCFTPFGLIPAAQELATDNQIGHKTYPLGLSLVGMACLLVSSVLGTVNVVARLRDGVPSLVAMIFYGVATLFTAVSVGMVIFDHCDFGGYCGMYYGLFLLLLPLPLVVVGGGVWGWAVSRHWRSASYAGTDWGAVLGSEAASKSRGWE